MPTNRWERLEDGVFLFRDSCNVYAVRGPRGTVLINAGTGLAAKHLKEIGVKGKLTLLLTHHLRDHSDGAVALHKAGAEVLGNYWDQDYYLDPLQHFQERQTWNSYDNRWDRYAPLRPLPVTGHLMDYETRSIAGLSWEVVPTPGATNGASSYVVTLPNKQRVAFVGETICGSGQVPRVAPLQYNYNDWLGTINVRESCNRLIETRAARFYPSLGAPVTDPEAAVFQLKSSLNRIPEIFPGNAMAVEVADDLQEVLPRLFLSKRSVANTHFVISKSNKVLSLDYGYDSRLLGASPGKQHLSNRRPSLHGLRGLKQRFGIERIDAVLISHYHDDHINGVPMLQRLFGTRVLAAKHFSEILERPERYDRPCLWHEPIRVADHLPCGKTVKWEDIPITLYPMSGHTRFSTLLCLEIDGTRVVHTGDQLFFHKNNASSSKGFTPGDRLFTNHVYKNGLDIGCYKQTLADLMEFKPDVVLSGHAQPYRTCPEWYDAIREGAEAFDSIHRSLMPLGEKDIHFGAESQAAKLKPYHAHLPTVKKKSTIVFEGWVLNPFPSRRQATLTLATPKGWKSNALELTLEPREQKEFLMRVQLPARAQCKRQPVGLELTVGERPFGQVTEALVTAGHPRF